MLNAVDAPPLGREYIHALHQKIRKCINTELFVLYASQCCELQFACFPLAQSNIYIQICASVCVYFCVFVCV